MNIGTAYLGFRSTARRSKEFVWDEKRTLEGQLLELVRFENAQHDDHIGLELTEGVDWVGMLSLAYEQGLAGLVYDRLLNTPALMESCAVISRFKYIYGLTERRNSEAYGHLNEVLGALRAEGIDPIVLKGAALATQFYGDVGLRPFVDTDILVKIEDVKKTHDVLVDGGYGLNYKGAPIDPPSDTDLRFRKARQYFHPDRGRMSIDPHWRLTRYPFLMEIDYDRLWERARNISLDGEHALALSPEDSIIQLSLDLTISAWYGYPELKTLCDIGSIRRSGEVDWQELLHAVDDSAIRTPAYYGLALTHSLLNATIPHEILGALRPKPDMITSWLQTSLETRVMSRETATSSTLLILLTRLLGTETLMEKARWLRQLAFPPRIFMAKAGQGLRRIFQRNQSEGAM